MRFKSQQRQDIFLFSSSSNLTLRSIQPHIQYVPGFFPWGIGLGHEVNHTHQSSAEVKNEWIYISIPLICFHGVDRDDLTFTFTHVKGKTFISVCHTRKKPEQAGMPCLIIFMYVCFLSFTDCLLDVRLFSFDVLCSCCKICLLLEFYFTHCCCRSF